MAVMVLWAQLKIWIVRFKAFSKLDQDIGRATYIHLNLSNC